MWYKKYLLFSAGNKKPTFVVFFLIGYGSNFVLKVINKV